MVMVIMMITVFSALSLSLVTANVSASREQRQFRETLSAKYASEAAISAAVFDLASGGTGDLGSEQEPMAMGRESYWVEATDLGDGLISLSATGVSNRSRAGVELIVRSASESEWRWGAFGDEELTMDSNSFVDSYDSRLGPYDSQDDSSYKGHRYATENGDVGSNGSIRLLSNAQVHGAAQAGVGESTTVTGNAYVSGSTVAAEDPFPMPTLDVPTIGASGSIVMASNSSGTLASGTYYFSSVDIGSNCKLAIEGPVTIVCDEWVQDSNAQVFLDAAGGGDGHLRSQRLRAEQQHDHRLDDPHSGGHPPQSRE